MTHAPSNSRLKPLGWLGHQRKLTLGELAATGHGSITLAAIETLGFFRKRTPPRTLPLPHAYGHLIPSAIDVWCLGFRWAVETTNSDIAVAGKALPKEFDAVARPQKLTRSQIVYWMRDTLSQIPLNQKHFDEIANQPAQLVLKGYSLIRWARSRHPDDLRLVLIGLVMIGLGSLWFFNRKRCSICYRNAQPGLKRCRHHSQSKLNIDSAHQSASLKSSSSRIARRVLNKPDLERAPSVQSSSAVLCVAGILWPVRSEFPWGSRPKLSAALAHAPSIADRLPANLLTLPYRQQLAHLREQTDPNEWASAFWDRKLEVAQLWSVSEIAVAPGRTGPSEVNRRRLAKASALLASGLLKSQVAEQLGVTRSALSKLLGRHGPQQGE